VGYLGAIIPTYDPSRAQVNITSPDRFNGDGSTVAFTLTYTVSFATDLEVFVDGVQQEPIEAFDVSGKTLTFTGAPGVGTNNIYVIYRAAVFNNYAIVPDGSITYAKLANNIKLFTEDIFTANGSGSTFVLTETPASANTVLVHIDGVLQSAPTNYGVSGTTLTFTSAPDASSKVVVKHLGFRTTSIVQSLLSNTVTTASITNSSVTLPKTDTLYYRLNTANTGADGTSAQNALGVGVTLTSGTQYEFISVIALSKSVGATSHNISFGFGGTATINNIGYMLHAKQSTTSFTDISAADTYTYFIQSASATVVTGAIASATEFLMVEIQGTVSVNVGGTFVPQYTLSAAPGGAYSTAIGSSIKLTPLGSSGSNVSIGTWA
jgi:hypothetical protein